MTTTTTVSELELGDRLLLPESPRHDQKPVEITHLQSLPRSGRIRIWVRSIYQQRMMFSSWNLGAFYPTDSIERIDD